MKSYPFPVQPMTAVRIIDYTFKVYRSKFKEIGFFGVFIYGTASLLFTGLIAGYIGGNLGFFEAIFNTGAGFGPDMLPRFFSSIFGLIGIGLIGAFIFGVLVTPFTNAAISAIVYEYYTGMPRRNIKEWFKAIMPKYGKIILTSLLAYTLLMLIFSVAATVFSLVFGIFMAVSMAASAFGVGGMIVYLIMSILFYVCLGAISIGFSSLIFPIMANEETYYMDAVSKAMKFIFARFWKTVGVFLIVMLLVSALSYALYFTLLMTQTMVTFADVGMLQSLLSNPVTYIFALIYMLVSIVLMPILPIASTLFYIDLRIVREGLDLSLREQDLSEEDKSGFSYGQWDQEGGVA